MRLQRFGLLAIALVGAGACGGDSNATMTTPGPLAYVRYVQAMPDTGQVDVRFVDQVENFPALAVGYRSVTPFQGVKAGSRHFRVFPTSTDPSIASQVILDTTIALAANSYYTILHTGYARTGQAPKQRFVVLQDALPAPSTTQVAIRALVASPGIGPVDAYLPSDTAAATPAAASFAGLTFGGAASWLNVGPASFALRLFASGTTTPMLGQLMLPAGAAQQVDLDPVAGTTIGGTAFTAFLFAPGVAGSANKSLTSAGITVGIDRRPPRQ